MKRQSIPLPINWIDIKLGDIVDVTSGIGFPKRYQGKTSGEYPFVKVADISRTVQGGTPILKTADNYIDSSDMKELRGNPLRKGTIIFAKIGEAIKLNRRAILAQTSFVDNNVMGIFPLPGACDQLYVYHYFLTVKLEELSRATTVPSIRKSDVENILLPLPPLNEQHRIVSKLEELFTKLAAGIEELKKAKKQIKRYRQAILKHAFNGKLTEIWREKHKDELEPVSNLLRKIEQEKVKYYKNKHKKSKPLEVLRLSKLPNGWEWTRCGNISLVITKGSTPTSYGYSYKTEGIRFIRTENIDEHGRIKNVTTFIDDKTNDFLRRSQLVGNDILFSIAGTIGRVGIVSQELLPANTNQALAIIRCPWDLICNNYLFYYFKSSNIQDQAIKSIVGVGRANISLTNISEFAVPIPSLLEQREIVNAIERYYSIADAAEKAIRESLKQAERLRQSILKKAFEGRLVPQDPNDEPVNVLLQRIKAEKEQFMKRPKKARRRRAS